MKNQIKHYHKGIYSNEGEIYFPLFNKNIAISIDFDVNDEYIKKCITSLQNLKDEIIDEICNYAIKYCEDYRKEFEELDIEIPEKIEGRSILKYLKPLNIIVKKTNLEEPAFCIEFNCDWEEEHGLGIIFFDNRVIYLGPYVYEFPYDETTKEYIIDMPGNYTKNN